ncbi:hypothetical protein CR513_17703, partial [Mucuna pruriens]
GESWLVLIGLFLPSCQFLMARTLNNGVSRCVSSLVSKSNDIQEVEVSATEVQRAVYKESKKKDCKALFLIHQCVEELWPIQLRRHEIF